MSRRTYHISQELDDGTVAALNLAYTNLRTAKMVLRAIMANPAHDVTRMFIDDAEGCAIVTKTVKR